MQPTTPAPRAGEAEARDLNQKGVDAYAARDYQAAAAFFQAALDKLPGDSEIQDNLDRAKAQIELLAKEKRADARAAAEILKSREQLREAFKAAVLRAQRRAFDAKLARIAAPVERYYTFAGNGLIGGVSWTLYANRTPGEPSKRMCEIIRQQSKLAGSAFDASADCQHYDFVLGMANSIDPLTDLRSRAVFDDLSNGKFSAREQGLYHKLRGKQFDELGCHSNGAMICLAALENRDVIAEHVSLYGPQVTRESLAMWDQLVRDGRLLSVKVYLNENDIVPGASIAYADYAKGRSISADAPLLLINPLKRTINEAAPRLLVQTFSCSRSMFSLDCHFMTMYNLKVNCNAKPSGRTVPGTGLRGKDDLPEPPLPCDAGGK